MSDMTGYWQANLKDLCEEIGEQKVETLFSGYFCPLNSDVEYFLKHKAILFSNQGFAATHLIFTSYQGKAVLIGYYAIAPKTININVARAKLPSDWRRRLSNFANYDETLNQYYCAMPLLAQLGKNFANGYDKLITGNELLQLACDRIHQIQRLSGGKMAYVECEDISCLVEFYKRNGFRRFANRNLDRDEVESNKCQYYVQMIRYFSSHLNIFILFHAVILLQNGNRPADDGGLHILTLLRTSR